MIRDTSIEAYEKIRAGNLLSKRRLEIYVELFDNGPMTANEIFRNIRGVSSINQANIPARLNEMRWMGVVRELGTQKCSVTGNDVILWDVTAKVPEKFKKEKKFNCPTCEHVLTREEYNRAIDRTAKTRKSASRPHMSTEVIEQLSLV